jgi:hypothetical protein
MGDKVRPSLYWYCTLQGHPLEFCAGCSFPVPIEYFYCYIQSEAEENP